MYSPSLANRPFYPLAVVVGLSDYETGKKNFAMTTPENKDQPTEERIGNLIGKGFALALVAFFLWAYWTAIAANLGLFR